MYSLFIYDYYILADTKRNKKQSILEFYNPKPPKECKFKLVFYIHFTKCKESH